MEQHVTSEHKIERGIWERELRSVTLLDAIPGGLLASVDAWATRAASYSKPVPEAFGKCCASMRVVWP